MSYVFLQYNIYILLYGIQMHSAKTLGKFENHWFLSFQMVSAPFPISLAEQIQHSKSQHPIRWNTYMYVIYKCECWRWIR